MHTSWLRLAALFLLVSPILHADEIEKPVGKVLSVEGEAFVTHKFKKAPVVAGEPVYARDKFQTKTGGRVVLDMNGASSITIGPDTRFNLTKTDGDGKSKTKVDLYSGSVKCKVAKLDNGQSFTVKTPSAVAGVRGTEFESTMDPGTMNCATVTSEGTVWNAAPENEALLDKALTSAQQSGPNAPVAADDKIKVVEVNQAAVFLPNGTGMVADVDPKSTASTGEMVQQLTQDLQMGKADAFLNEQSLQMDLNMAERLQVLEDRLQNIEQAQAAKELPGPPSTPDR